MFRFLLHSTTVLAVLAGLFGLTACQTQNIRAGRPLVNLVRPTDLPTEPKTTRAAQMISLETPLRCTIEETQKNIMTAVPFKQEAFKLERAEQSDTLPLFEVKGFSFDGQTAEKVFYKLLSGAKIKVIGVDGPFPELAAENITGELSDVMEMIASAADVYYRYDAKQKTLFVSREIGWNLFVPDRREVMIAVLDSLRGAGMHDLSVNWEENVISFKGDKGTENKVRQLIDLFDKEPNLIVFNVQVLRVKPLSPAKEINWQDLIETFGAGTIRVSVNGVLGRSLVTAHKINAQSLSRFLTPRAQFAVVSEGMFIAADKWRARFDVGRCGYMSMPEAQLSLMAQTELYGDRGERMKTVLTLDSMQGEITSFKTKNTLGDNILLIGIPASSFADSLKGYETVVVLTPHIIRLVKEIV